MYSSVNLKCKSVMFETFLLLLLFLLGHQNFSAAQVNGGGGGGGGGQISQLNNSLPVLSERANGVNSRYLSAASTASLAAATVAASNAVPQGASGSTSNQEANRNYLLHHQQQQQQQQQQQLPLNTNNQAPNQATNNGQQQQQQLSTQSNGAVAGASQLGGSQAPQQYNGGGVQTQQVPLNGANPPATTTYTFNPVTGQFTPTDPSAASSSPVNNLLANNNNNQAGYNPYFVASHQQQQQPFQLPFVNSYGQPTTSTFASYPYNRQQQQQAGSRFPGQQSSLATSAGNVNGPNQYPYNQFIGPQRQFTRRNGYGAASSSSRLPPNAGNNVNIFGLQQQQQQQPANIEDDSGFFQQQVTNTGGGLVNNNGIIGADQQLLAAGAHGAAFNGLDALFANLPGNNYLVAANQHQLSANHHSHQQQPFSQEQANLLAQSSSSVVPVSLAATPPTSFGAAYSSAIPEHSRPDQCVAADNRHGTCYQASECIKRGGTPMGKCGTTSNEYSGSSYVCCLFDVTCGQFAAERFVYFRNPNYPNTFDQSRMCRAKIGKLDKGTCQFRLDMIRFDVAKPTNGNCSTDMFVVSGQNENYVIPKICGLNDGQHYYVGVDESGVITLHMMMMGYYRRSFEVLITQIPCRSDYAAPAHCLQYYMGTHGTIKSFNYDDDHSFQQQQSGQFDLLQPQASQQDGSTVSLTGNPTAPYGLNFASNQAQQRQQQQLFAAASSSSSSAANRYHNIYQNYANQDQYGGYPNDLDYTMCIRKESGFCSITYQLSRGEQGLQPFAVGHSIFGANDSSLGQFGGNGGGWHPVSTECRDDYLLIGGVRLCSGTPSQYPLVGGSPFDNSVAIQFAQNGSILGSAGIGGHPSNQQVQLQLQQQQLQQQHGLIMQQLARIQQQQAALSAGGNVSYANGVGPGNGNNNQAPNSMGQQGGNLNNLNGNAANLEQQQAALIQQSMLIQQQLNLLASGGGNNFSGQNNRYNDGYLDSLQGAIITDTTSGPFILRFVSNLARNARGFHIDYRQNPCK